MSLLEVNNVGKAFRTYRSEWQRFAGWFGLPVKAKEEHWVLRNISFSIQPGEAVGIVGMNGAGKSTLLKMITGTLQPSEGHIHLQGRISAILELGMGFNPDLTGRQNVYHAAGLMGFNLEEINAAMPEIEAFAEIGEYFDEPVRVYSSGMQVRVAFSVATAYRPETLIVDEALSVGDAYFQHKSFDRIRKFQAQGTTLLIVSHDRSAIQSLCDRAILLKSGKLAMEGEPESVMDFYNAILADKENHKVEQKVQEGGKVQTVSGTGEVTVAEVLLLDNEERPIEVGAVGQPVILRVSVICVTAIDDLVIGYMIKDRLGQPVFGTNTYHHKQTLCNLEKDQKVTFDFAFDLGIGEGNYSVSVALHGDVTHVARNYEWCDRALVFSVVNTSVESFVGVAWVPPEIRCVS